MCGRGRDRCPSLLDICLSLCLSVCTSAYLCLYRECEMCVPWKGSIHVFIGYSKGVCVGANAPGWPRRFSARLPACFALLLCAADIEAATQTDRQTDTQTDRQTDRKTEPPSSLYADDDSQRPLSVASQLIGIRKLSSLSGLDSLPWLLCTCVSYLRRKVSEQLCRWLG